MVSEPEQPANVTALRTPSRPRPRPHLPAQPTRLIGREAEVAAALSLLGDPAVRLLTLTGPAGIGKTRLALAVAEHAASAFAAGATFVDLAPVREAGLVMPAIARAVGIEGGSAFSPLAALQRVLGARQVLLVLDNFEHVLPAAAAIAALLEACPDVKVLATSRAPLRLRWEQELPLGPLAVPDPTHLPPHETLAAVPAVALFVERARAARPAFALTEENATAVAALCVRLEGVPLAIELAAAWLRLLPPQAMLERLGHRLDLLTGGAQDLPARQRTLRDALAWSYTLLSAQDQTLFRRLGIFVGGWTLEAAEDVCSDHHSADSTVLNGLEVLVESSLVQRRDDPSDGPRFGMLETVREFGLEQLAAAGKDSVLRDRHADHYLALAESAGLRSLAVVPRAWRGRLTAEQDNLRAALAWVVTGGDAARGLRFVAALEGWYHAHAPEEGRRWTEAVLALPGVAECSVARAKALTAAGVLAMAVGDMEAARARLEDSVRLWRELDDPLGLGWALHAVERGYPPDLVAARAAGEEAVAVLRTTSDAWALAMALATLGHTLVMMDDVDALRRADAVLEESLPLFAAAGGEDALPFLVLGRLARRRGDHATARARFEESLARFRASGQAGAGIPLVLAELGWLAYEEDHLDVARPYFEESLRIAGTSGNMLMPALGLWWLAGVAVRRGAPVLAARLLGAAATVLAGREPTAFDAIPAPYQEMVATVRRALGEAAFAEAWAAGTAMTLDEASAEALALPPEPLPDGPATARDRLTARELEVLGLLAAGHTNRGIAEALVLSRRTVDRHLANIYAKIGAQGRADAAAYAVRRHLIPSS